MRRHIFTFSLVVALLAISGCGTNPEVQLVEISKNTVVYDEIVRINNCGGKGDSDHTATREFATTIEFGAGISAGYKSVVEGNIAAKYSEYRNTSKSLRVVAPPGTNMEFVLRWSDDVRAGNVQVNGKSGSYEVRIPISVEQISSRDLGCGVISQPSLGQTTPAAPSSGVAIPTPNTSQGKYPCLLVIKQSEVDRWKVGQMSVPAVQEAINQFDARRPHNEGAFVKGTTIPSGVVVATNFDERDANAWTRYPVIPLIHSGSWGLFQTTGEFVAPNAGACMTVVP